MPGKKIMVVDDEENLIKLLKEILEQEGYEVIPASGGEECLEKLKTVKPDLILLDMMMPFMSGRDVCKKIRDNPETKDLKVVFLTVAKLSETGIESLKKLKITDYITKPFDNEDLIKRTKMALG